MNMPWIVCIKEYLADYTPEQEAIKNTAERFSVNTEEVSNHWKAWKRGDITPDQPGKRNMVTSSQCIEGPVHHFITEASTLGLAPGDFPYTIETDMGNKQPFIRKDIARQGREITSVGYLQGNGCISLRVLND